MMEAARFIALMFRPAPPVGGLECSQGVALPGTSSQAEALEKLRAALREDADLIGGTLRRVR